MFKVEHYLLLVKDVESIDCFDLEDCEKHQEGLNGIHVVLPKENLDLLLNFVENELQNPTYVYNLLTKNTIKGMDLLANMLKISSYTNEFIKHYGGIQEILDLFKVVKEETVEQPLFNPTVSLSDLSDSADNSNAAGDSVNTKNSEYIVANNTAMSNSSEDYIDTSVEPDNSCELECANKTSINSEVLTSNTGMSETQEEHIKTYNQTNELMNSEESLSAPIFDDMMLMIRAIAAKIGVLDEDDTPVLTQEDILYAKLYINEFSAASVRDGLIDVLDKAQTKEELKAITTFMAMFISYMRGL